MPPFPEQVRPSYFLCFLSAIEYPFHDFPLFLSSRAPSIGFGLISPSLFSPFPPFHSSLGFRGLLSYIVDLRLSPSSE